jgi:dipeptidyl aminopeptidase/acylaminoacyl peptidase
MNFQRLTRNVVFTACALAGSVLAAPHDGKLLASIAVTPTEEKIRSMEAANADIRSILARVSVKAITYLSDGLRVKGYLAMPKQGSALPCVIFNRGGNREFGALDDDAAVLFLARMASWGYVVVASQYRGNAGGEGREEFGGSDINDVLNLLPLIGALPQVDARRVGMYGWSRGGMMTYMALTKTDRIAAAVVESGMSDAFDTIARRPEMEDLVYSVLVPEYEDSRQNALFNRSPVRWPGKLSKGTPILLLHGTADERVNASQTLRMASGLLEARHPFRLVLFEGGDHDLHAHQAEVERLVRSWFDRYVRDRIE